MECVPSFVKYKLNLKKLRNQLKNHFQLTYIEKYTVICNFKGSLIKKLQIENFTTFLN